MSAIRDPIVLANHLASASALSLSSACLAAISNLYFTEKTATMSESTGVTAHRNLPKKGMEIMSAWMKVGPSRSFASGLVLGLSLGIAMLAGAIITHQESRRMDGADAILRAATADAGDSLAIATGPIDQGIEGVFFLDFVTGRLSGSVMNPKTLQPLGGFVYANVYVDLGIPDVSRKAPKLLMATGYTNVKSYTGGTSLADSIIYIADTDTGNFAAYGVPWNKAALNWNTFQPVNMVLLGTGSARAVRERK